MRRPRKGHVHPASKEEILNLLRFFGEECIYGLEAIELRQGGANQEKLQLGLLKTPGNIVLFDQPLSPWTLLGVLPAPELKRFHDAGAEVELDKETGQTRVRWLGDSLRDFMFFDVLMHEIGHHLLQHYKGKRRMRVARTKDHEAFADRFARQCRELYVLDQGKD